MRSLGGESPIECGGREEPSVAIDRVVESGDDAVMTATVIVVIVIGVASRCAHQCCSSNNQTSDRENGSEESMFRLAFHGCLPGQLFFLASVAGHFDRGVTGGNTPGLGGSPQLLPPKKGAAARHFFCGNGGRILAWACIGGLAVPQSLRDGRFSSVVRKMGNGVQSPPTKSYSLWRASYAPVETSITEVPGLVDHSECGRRSSIIPVRFHRPVPAAIHKLRCEYRDERYSAL